MSSAYFGRQTFGRKTFGQHTIGQKTFGWQTIGRQTFGQQSFGEQTVSWDNKKRHVNSCKKWLNVIWPNGSINQMCWPNVCR